MCSFRQLGSIKDKSGVANSLEGRRKFSRLVMYHSVVNRKLC